MGGVWATCDEADWALGAGDEAINVRVKAARDSEERRRRIGGTPRVKTISDENSKGKCRGLTIFVNLGGRSRPLIARWGCAMNGAQQGSCFNLESKRREHTGIPHSAYSSRDGA